MAGGPSTPELVNAVGFGFLAWGTCSLDQAREELSRVEEPFGVNLFYPQREEPLREDLEAIASELGAEIPEPDYTFGFHDKLDLALEDGRATIISCTFGCFTEEEFRRIHDAGIQAWVTVTNEVDALKATERGADGLIVQGPKAGGHRSTWTLTEEPDPRPLEKLLDGIFRNVNVPLIAAGGARCAEDVEYLIEWGGYRRRLRECLLACRRSRHLRPQPRPPARRREFCIYPCLLRPLRPRRGDLLHSRAR